MATSLVYPLVNAADVEPTSDGFFGNNLTVQTGISAGDGSSSAAYKITVGALGQIAPTLNIQCDEILFLAKGQGRATVGGTSQSVWSRHCFYIPKGVAFAFENTGEGAAEFIGFLLGAGDAKAAGRQRADDAVQDSEASGGLIIHLDDVSPAAMDAKDGWSISEFRLPLGGHNGCPSTFFHARFFPGAMHKKHRHDNCEEIYFIASGHGVAGAGPDLVEVRAGDFHHIPRGVEHWLNTLTTDDPLEAIGVYIGAGSVADTAYAYMGDVTEADLDPKKRIPR
jgi:mannose-6-phosphate isomerase-like protein (cupin superfamily)